jgi:anti-sigma regulatory factor (Ser/Thr protein kinase)
MGEWEHEVAAYDDADGLHRRVSAFVAAGLRAGQRVVTVCSPDEVAAVDALLVEAGLDPVRARRHDRLVTLDAEEVLARLVVDGVLDPGRFRVLADAALPAGGPPARLYGRVVALLWERGDVVSALELEACWTRLARERPLHLLCAYPASLLAESTLGDVARMCDLHDAVSLLGEQPGARGAAPSGRPAVTSVHLPVPAAVTSVRRFVEGTLRGWGLDDLVDDAALVTSELATNAVTHALSPFRTTVARVEGGVRLAVEDASAAWPERQHALEGDQQGRGMAIVEALAARAGCDPTPQGKVAWAELTV